MKQRKWDSKTKLRAVLEGLKGRSVAEICNSYQIQPSQYYQWRDRFFFECRLCIRKQENSFKRSSADGGKQGASLFSRRFDF